ncbi:MAG: hypothetical protein U1B83_01375, partial [Candidatus Cloacimonadaceae bacterium]|nr:hypothetical protein [Candidatus Cloacimonadaceae bacterium]
MLAIDASSDYTPRLRVDIRNSAFYNNRMSRAYNQPTAKSINDTLFISNCTFADNSLGAAIVTIMGTSVLTNNIFHNPEMDSQIWIPSNSSSGASHTTLIHNNIHRGLGGVYNTSSAYPLIWGPDNTNYDPLFSYEGNRPYTLSSLSPLIDTGWQYASGLAQPGYDAGGNERLWDGDGDGIAVIDIGAYEYQPLFSPQNLAAELWQNQLLLSWEMPVSDRGLSGYRVFRDHLPYAVVSGAGNTYFREHLSQADTLVYQVAALYGNVESALSDSVVVIVFTTDNADDLAPAVTKLSIGPNPFSDIAVIRYTLPKASKVDLKIYNLRGQLVRNLESGTKNPGEH